MVWRYLKHNASVTSPQSIFTVDTETRRTDHPIDPGRYLEVFRLGVVRYCRLEKGIPTRRNELAFNHPDQFWNFVAKQVRPRELNWIFAHGMGFDLRVLKWPEMVDLGKLLLRPPAALKQQREGEAAASIPPAGLLVFQDTPTILECWYPGGAKLRLVDTRNYWNCKLADLGRSVGLDKLPMPDPWESDETWLAYCRVDCEILETAVLKLIAWHRSHQMGVFKPTAAGMAMNCFRHRWNKPQIVLHDELPIRKLERAAYYAGQLQSFYVGPIAARDKGVGGLLFDKWTEDAPRPVGPVHQLDANSLFPSVMRGGWYPRRLLRWKSQDASARSLDIQLDQGFAADVLVSSPDATYPLRSGGMTHHCIGTFRTQLCGLELWRAIRSGHVQEVFDWSEYELAELFTGFVDYFWQVRGMAKLAGQTTDANLCKLILNSLYGKWAQHSHEWENRPELLASDRWGHWNVIDLGERTVKQFRAIGDMVQERLAKDEHEQAFPAISAFITAAARERMLALRQIAGVHNVYYQAVDSLYTSDVGLERLTAAGEVDQWTLGKLRLEYSAADADFLGYNYYRIGERRTLSSIRATARQVSADEFEQDLFERLDTSFARPPLGGVSVRKIARKMHPHEPLSGKTLNGWVRPLDARLCMSMPTAAETFSNCGRPAISTWLGSGHGIPSPKASSIPTPVGYSTNP